MVTSSLLKFEDHALHYLLSLAMNMYCQHSSHQISVIISPVSLQSSSLDINMFHHNVDAEFLSPDVRAKLLQFSLPHQLTLLPSPPGLTHLINVRLAKAQWVLVACRKKKKTVC